MAPFHKSRWADDDDDPASESKRRRERRQHKAERASKPAAQLSHSTTVTEQRKHDDHDERPAKKRKFSPEPTGQSAPTAVTQAGATPPPAAQTRALSLYRFHAGLWSRSASVDNYDKLNDIEEGTYGWVARARNVATGAVVALKRLKLDPRDRNGLPVTGLREIQILTQCSHRNIVKLEEVVVGGDGDKPDNPIFLVLEFVEHDIKTILEDMPEPFLPSETKRLLMQLASGLEYLHDNWILHRDLKTSNLLLNNRGQLKIADFGMARYVGDPPPHLTQLVVTLWYRAPELLMGTKSYDQAVDMWSVGCIFAELLSREPLLQGTNEADQVAKIFEVCGIPTETTWPGFRQLPNARALKLPKSSTTARSVIRQKFPFLTNAGCSLLNSLLSLDPDMRPRAKEMLEHEYFSQDPKPKPESMFPTFPSKAGQEHRRRHEPHAPARGEAVELGSVDFSGIFQGREKEERGAGFSLRMV